MSKLKKLNVSEVDGNENSIFSAGTVWIDQENRLRVSDGVTEGGQPLTLNVEGTVYPSAGSSTAGIIFPSDPGGGSGDIASIKYYAVDGEQMRLHIDVQNDSDDHILVSASGNITIQPNEKAFVFGTDGVLTLPGNIVTSTLYTDNNGYRLNIEGNNGGITVAKLVLDNDNGHIRLVVGNVSTPSTWAFGTDGNITLPEGGDILDSNGASVLGGGASTGDITFDAHDIIGDPTVPSFGKMNLVPNANYKNAGQYLQIYPTLGNDAPHIHLAAGLNGNGDLAGDLMLGDDFRYVEINHGGNVRVGAYNTEISSTYIWTFDGDGDLTFPDATVQTTAWAGGRVVAAPASSVGSAGDRVGDIAFDGDYFYYCTAPYGGYTVTLLGGYSNGPFPTVLKGEYPQPQTGWSFVWDSVTYTLVSNATDPNPGEWFLPVDQNIDTGAGGTISLSPPGVDIWKRVAWGAGTW